jgi:hypothetical protein
MPKRPVALRVAAKPGIQRRAEQILGRYPDRVQLNAMVYTGPPVTPPVAQSVTPTRFPELRLLDFDPSLDFHVHGMEWTPDAARFTVDGSTVHGWSRDIARLKLPMNILLTIWASSAAGWAGPIAATRTPVSADYGCWFPFAPRARSDPRAGVSSRTDPVSAPSGSSALLVVGSFPDASDATPPG